MAILKTLAASVEYVIVDSLVPQSWRGYGPVWVLLASFVAVAVIILIWGIDWSGPDRTPPSPVFTSASGTVPWDGGLCIDLGNWTGSKWEDVGYASFDDATVGVWGPPQGGERFCKLAAVSGSVLLPTGAMPGIYRVCNIGAEPDCVEFVFSQE